MIKEKTETTIIQPEEKGIDTKLELLRYVSEVQSRIKKDVSSDFILAKLEQKDKEGIIEMTSNAYFTKKLMAIIKERAREYKWNKQKREWTKEQLNNKTTHKNQQLQEQ